jgi:hypothetical protein
MGLQPIGAILLIASLVGCRVQPAPQTRLYPKSTDAPTGVLHLHCTWTEPYCGGAEPDPRDLPRPVPWSGRLFIRAAAPDSTGKMAINDLRRPIIDSIRMDGAGHGHLTLPFGDYLLLDRDRLNDRKARQLGKDHGKPAMYTEPIDTACLRQWLHGPFGVFSITSRDTLQMEYPMYGQCPWYATPCVRYNGPLPP